MTGGVPARPGLGIALILLMAACFATMDTAVKYVGAVLPILIVLLVFGVLIFLAGTGAAPFIYTFH